MKLRIPFVLTAMTLMTVTIPGASTAAHFSSTGTSTAQFRFASSFTQFEWCNFSYSPSSRGVQTATIDPDGTEKAGDPVTISYCYSGVGSVSTPGPPYVTIAGIGDSSSFSVGCLPDPAYTTFTKPATVVLNPGAGQTTILSYGPRILSGNSSVAVPRQCDTIQAHIGDRLAADVGTFVLLYNTQRRTNPDSGGTASISITFDATINAQAPVPESTTLFVPVVLSSTGRNGSFFTSEMVETNNGPGTATVSYAYTDATGGAASGSATNPQPLAAGRQRVVSDVIAHLRGLGIPIPAAGNAVGTLRVTFANLHAASDAAITVRTTTPVPPAASTGRAGLTYFGVPPAGLVYAGTRATLCGLKQNASDRSNVAVQNAGAPGDGDLTLRVTWFPSFGSPSPDVFVTLPPGGFRQFALTDLDPAAADGFATVAVVSGTAAFYAYAVVNDQVNSDGSFIPPLKSGTGAFSAVLLLPTVVETPTFTTEVVVTNLASAPQSGTLTFTSASLAGPATLAVTLGPYEQRTFPAFVQALRAAGVPGVPPAGGTVVGTLTWAPSSGDTTAAFIGGRTLNAGGGGRYGVFTSGQPHDTGADAGGTWLYGLRQDAENRTNVALVNAGDGSQNPITLRIDLYDGETGAAVASLDQAVPARGFVQLNAILAAYAPSVFQAYARVTRVSGANRFVTYAVVNDGALPGQRSGDGAVIPMDPFDVYRYAGSWQNTTFATTGPITSTSVIERASSLVLSATTVGGNVFGGGAPPPFTIRGTQSFTSVVLNGTVSFLGPISANISLVNGVLSGSAPSVPGPNVSALTFTGRNLGISISGTYTATLRPSGSANGTFTMALVP